MEYIQCRNCQLIWQDDYDGTHCDCNMSIDENCFPISCYKCSAPLSLEEGAEWPSQKLYCWECAHEKLAHNDWQDATAMLLETWKLAARLQNEVESDEAFRELSKRIDENWIEASRKAKR